MSILSAALSLLSCAFVCLTIAIFPRIRADHFNKVIFFFFFYAALGYFPLTFGFPPTGTFLCELQAFTYVYFFSCSTLWMLFLFAQFHSIIVYGKYFLSTFLLTLVAFLFSAIILAVACSHLPFGRPIFFPPFSSGLGACIFSAPSYEEFNQWFVYPLEIESAFFIISVSFFAVKILWKFRNLGISSRPLAMWPLIAFISWCPFILTACLYYNGALHASEANNHVFLYLFAWTTQAGTLFSLSFFINSPPSRDAWKSLLKDGSWNPLLNSTDRSVRTTTSQVPLVRSFYSSGDETVESGYPDACPYTLRGDSSVTDDDST